MDDDYGSDSVLDSDIPDFGDFDVDPNKWEDAQDDYKDDAEGDAADLWLKEVQKAEDEAKESVKPESSTESESVSELDGMSTVGFMEQRFDQMEPRVQAFAALVANDPVAAARRMGGAEAVDAVNLAKSSFEKTIGRDSRYWAKHFTFDESVSPTASKMEQNMVLSMMGTTAEAFLKQGPGGTMIGQHLSPEKDAESKDEIDWAIGFAKKLAGKYQMAGTKEMAPDLYGERVSSTTDAIIDYWVNEHRPAAKVYDLETGEHAVYKEGLRKGDLIYASTILPLPNELGIFGLTSTPSWQGHQGSPFTRAQYDAFANSPEWDKFTPEQRGAMQPHISGLIQPKKISKGEKRALSDNQIKDLKTTRRRDARNEYDEVVSDSKKARGILQKLMLNTSDENYQNYKHVIGLGISDEQRDQSDFIHEAQLLDLSYEKRDTVAADLSTNTKGDYRAGATVYGSDQGGKYSSEGMSDSDTYQSLRSQGYEVYDPDKVIEEPYASNKYLYEDNNLRLLNKDYVDTFVGPADPRPKEYNSDREAYLAYTEQRLSEGTLFEQGTEGWKDQRKGKLSASLTGTVARDGKSKKFLSKEGQIMAAQNLIDPQPFVSNADIVEGQEYEDLARKSFESMSKKEGTGLTVEDAYFEENPNYEGMGVSPDGRVFDEAGKSHGLVEFKVHKTEAAMKKSLSTYMNQLQFQMAITGEDQVHFYRINRQTRKAEYDVVKADPALQKRIIEAGYKSIELAGEGMEILRGGTSGVLDEAAIDLGATVFNGPMPEPEATVFTGPIQEGRRRSFVESEKSEKAAQRKEATDATARFKRSQALSAKIMDVTETAARTKDKDRKSQDLAEMASNKKRFKNEQDIRNKLHKLDEDIAKKKLAMAKQQADEQTNMLDKQKKASQEATQATMRFAKTMSKFVGGAAGLLKEGAGTELTDIRVGAESGWGGDKTRGARYLLSEQGGMTDQDALSMVQATGNFASNMQSETTGVPMYTGMQKRLLALRNNEGMSAINLGDYQSTKAMSGSDLMARMLKEAGKYEDPKQRAAVLSAFDPQYKKLATAVGEVTPDQVQSASMTVHEEQARAGYKGISSAEHMIERVKETGTNFIGETGNYVAAGFGGVLAGAARLFTLGDTATAGRGALTASRVALGSGVAGVASGSILTGGITAAVMLQGEAFLSGDSMKFDSQKTPDGKPMVGDGGTRYIPSSELLNGGTRFTPSSDTGVGEVRFMPSSDVGNVSLPKPKDIDIESKATNVEVSVSLGEDVAITKTTVDNFSSDTNVTAYGDSR